jgi:flagellar FliJ protein
MVFQYKFEKLLSLKTSEKDKAMADYQKALEEFEQVAEKLYEYLKKKEDLEQMQSEQLRMGLSIQEIRHQQQMITNLEKTIMHYQKLVIQARERINFFKNKLLEKNIEVKKFEKLKENCLQHFFTMYQAFENKQMDEISIQQYLHRES